jgi:hypothetical protein
MEFQILTTVISMFSSSWYVTQCSLVRENICIASSILQMEATNNEQ